MSCMLRVSGKQFESRKYSERTDLPLANVYVRGEPRFRSDPTGKKNMTSGITITVSRADFTNFKRQVRDATAFLAKHKRQLARLRNKVGVEKMVLDFGV